MTPPNMMPTSGTTMMSANVNFRSSARKIPVPSRANTVATAIFTPTASAPKNTVATRTPREADSAVPAVDGVTKRLRVRLIITRPATLSAEPASRIASSRGSRDSHNTVSCRSSPESRPAGVNSVTPTKSEPKDAAASSTSARAT